MKRLVSFGLWALAVLVPGQAAAQTAQQFDVVCAVEERWRDPELRAEGEPTSGVEQVQMRFRVDLQAMRFCAGACLRIEGVPTENLTSEINLSHTPQYPSGRSATYVQEARLNRLTGTISTFARIGTAYTSRGTGICRREPFSGFPEAVF